VAPAMQALFELSQNYLSCEQGREHKCAAREWCESSRLQYDNSRACSLWLGN
jgi:hypothetical protein